MWDIHFSDGWSEPVDIAAVVAFLVGWVLVLRWPRLVMDGAGLSPVVTRLEVGMLSHRSGLCLFCGVSICNG